MSIFDDIKDGATSKKILVAPTPGGINPSLDSNELIPSNIDKDQTDQTDPSPDTLLDIDTGALPEEIHDMRVSQNTGKLIHNWWVYYLKSLKKFLGNSFDDSINNFEFNYANKTVLLKKLYKQMDVLNPSCIINLTSFRTDSNLDTKRRNSNFYNLAQTTILAKNITKNLEVRVDFKFVNITQSITLNFDDATDVLNYYDRFTTVFPLNKDFINYEYRTLINLHNETEGWGIDDDTTGIVWDASVLGADNYAGDNGGVNKPPQRWGEYKCCPQFTLTGINQLIDRSSQKYQLQIDLNTLLRVPQTIITRLANEMYIKSIQVILDIGTQQTKSFAGKAEENGNLDAAEKAFTDSTGVPTFTSSDKPICIDIDRDIYESYRMENVLYLSVKLNFDKVNGKLLLPPFLEDAIKGKAAALYIIQDSTNDEPGLYWTELGYLYSPNSQTPILNLSEQNIQNDYTIEARTVSYLESVGVEIESDDKELIINTLEIPLPNFKNIEAPLNNAGAWFDARLFLFTVTDEGIVYH